MDPVLQMPARIVPAPSALTQNDFPKSPEEQFLLARKYSTGEGVEKNAATAFALMQSAASQKHPEAISGLGYYYLNGVGVEMDEEKALECFRRGAELGHSRSQLNLGMTLLNRKFDPESISEGLAWVEKAAQSGLDFALMAAGRIHFSGLFNSPVDLPKAFQYYSKAAMQDNPDAQALVGWMHEQGAGTPKNPDQSAEWYRKAAEQKSRLTTIESASRR